MNNEYSILLSHMVLGGRIQQFADTLNISKSVVHRVLDRAQESGVYNWKKNKKGDQYKTIIRDRGDDILTYINSLSLNSAQKPEIVNITTRTHKKLVAFPDIHYPDNINLTAIEKFLADYQPDVIIYLGDTLDLRYLSKFDKDNKLIAKDKLREEYDAVMTMMDKHISLSKASEVYYVEGNHEFRVQKVLESEPVGKGFVEIPEAMKLKERGIEWVELNKWVKIGKLFFTHGIYCNMYHARKHVETCQRNVIYGHTHTIQVHSGVHPYDKDLPHIAKSIGCLCDLNPAYMKNRPSQWMNGFYIAEIESDDTFTDTIIPVVNGSFRVPGLTSRRYEIV